LSVEALRLLISEGEKTDKKISLVFPFLPPALLFVGYILLLASIGYGRYYPVYGMVSLQTGASLPFILVFAALGFMLASVVLGIYLIYLWISRRNRHFSRTLSLYEVLCEILRAKGFENQALSIRDWLSRMRLEQGEYRSPAKWIAIYIVASMIPLIGLIVTFYIYHFLNRDFVRHDRYEREILVRVNEALKTRNMEILSLVGSELGSFPNRNTVIYAVLTMVTLSLFTLYWWYTLTNDPNKHFEAHRLIESELASKIALI